MKIDDFLAAGYSQYKVHDTVAGRSADVLLQKVVYDEDGDKKYYINVWAYNWEKYRKDAGWGFEADVQLYKDGRPFRIEYPVEISIQDMEDMIKYVFDRVGCDLKVES